MVCFLGVGGEEETVRINKPLKYLRFQEWSVTTSSILQAAQKCLQKTWNTSVQEIIFFLQVCFIRQGETFNRMNKYSWWLFHTQSEMYFSSLVTLQYVCGFLARASMRQKWIIHCISARTENKTNAIAVIEEQTSPTKMSVAHLFPL